MFIKQSLAVLALFLASDQIAAIRTKTEEDMPVILVANRGDSGNQFTPSWYQSQPRNFLTMDESYENEDDDEPEVVPIVLALKRVGHRHNKRNRQPQLEALGMQPSDYASPNSPGVILMKNIEKP